MIINNITLFNYRLYEGANTIKFSPAESKNIYLISGENGFGKQLSCILFYGVFMDD